MNADQWQSLIRSGLKFAAGALAAHSLTLGSSILSSEPIIAGALALGSLIWSHYFHKDA